MKQIVIDANVVVKWFIEEKIFKYCFPLEYCSPFLSSTKIEARLVFFNNRKI